VYFSGKRVNVSEFDSCQEMSEKKSCHGKLSIAYYKCGFHWCLLGCFGFILLLKRIFLFGKLFFEDFTVTLK